MARIRFSSNFDRHAATTVRDFAGTTVRSVLGDFFDEWPQLQGVILDDRGAVRPHVRVFVDGQPISDREHLSDAVSACGVIFVTEAT